MLMGRATIGCECGFGTGSPAPPPLEVVPPPRRGPTLLLCGLAAGALSGAALVELGAVLGWTRPAGALAAGLAVAGLLAGGWGGWWWWRRRRWFESATLCEDPAIRRALLSQVRKVFESAERNRAGQVDVFLAERGITAPEFRAAVVARLTGSGPAA
jgi:hypothetical protein